MDIAGNNKILKITKYFILIIQENDEVQNEMQDDLTTEEYI